jgi:hypothetical protein
VLLPVLPSVSQQPGLPELRWFGMDPFGLVWVDFISLNLVLKLFFFCG